MDLKRGIDLAVTRVVEDLKARSKPVANNNEIAQIGIISANGDEIVGRKISEAMEKVGKEGVITVEEATGIEFELDVVEGMQFDRGFLSPYFEIGRASCRERVCQYVYISVVAGSLKKKKNTN